LGLCPRFWPGAVYSLEVGIVGTEGVLTIDDTHRDIVLRDHPGSGRGLRARPLRGAVDFLGSYPPGDIALGELARPDARGDRTMAEPGVARLTTQHATAPEAHHRLMLHESVRTSARLKRAVPLPMSAEDERPRVGLRAAG